MTIKCFFGDYTSHANEKKMLEQFLTQLQPIYGNSNEWVYVIYNAMWNGQEIDLVCITQNGFIVADLKNYSGSLTGQENGEWKITNYSNELLTVKGGGQINPFVQVRKNRYAIMDWLKNNNLLLSDNIGHMAAMIIFTEISDLRMNLSHSVNQWFHVSDLPHIGPKIESIRSSEINITETEADEIIQVLNLQPYEWTPTTPVLPNYSPFIAIIQDEDKPQFVDYSSLASNISDTGKVYTETKYTKLSKVYLPFGIILLMCAGLTFFSLSGKSSNPSLPKLTSSLLPEPIKKFADTFGIKSLFDRSGLYLITADKDDDADFIAATYEDAKLDRKDKVRNILQLLDLKENTVYGFKIGETKLSEINRDLRLKDSIEPKKNRTTYALYQGIYDRAYTDVLKDEHKTYNKKFPPMEIDGLKNIQLYLDEKDTLIAIIYSLKTHSNKIMIEMAKSYSALGYDVVTGNIEPRMGDQYAILNKGDDYVILRDMHLSHSYSIAHTNKATFDQYGESLVNNGGITNNKR